MEARAFTEIRSAGTVDHSVASNGFDASDRDDAIDIRPHDVLGLRMPDAIAAFSVNGETFYATANEGDGRDYDAFGDEARVEDLDLDPTAYPDAAALQAKEALGRLNASSTDGDVDGDGDIDRIHSFGSRGFTIYDADGDVVFDSGDDFERIVADLAPGRFNADNDDPFDFDGRSDAKGPEPEAIAVAEVDGRTLAFIGLERSNGIMVYDVTEPAKSRFLTYIDPVDDSFGDDPTEEELLASDLGPETIAVIPADESESGLTEIAVANEISGSISVYSLDLIEPAADYTLELLHFADQEASAPAVFDAPRLSAGPRSPGAPRTWATTASRTTPSPCLRAT